MRIILIGDVHGCIDELKILISECKLNTGDYIFFLGDLINKVPNSIGVLNYVLFLSEYYNVKLIIGNHEEKFLRFLYNKKNNLPPQFTANSVQGYIIGISEKMLQSIER